MTRWERSWVVDVLAAFAPSSLDVRALAPRDGEVDYLRTWRRMLQGATPLARLGMRVALCMVALAPLWLLGRFATFSKLARSERTEVLSRLLRHTSHFVRELALLLKFSAAVALLGTPSVRARSGYDNVQPPASVERDHGRRVLPVLEPGTRVSLPPNRAAS
ncbi:MAG TPA: hypothetical protein VJR89_30985 [Polyangiales bacterium]|nr:hypothetical protein [Polyangiales bacterium]